MIGVDHAMAGLDLDLVARLERSMLSSWPALSVAFDGDWVIRLAGGVTKRSNSVTCLGADDRDLDARIDRMEAIYARHRLPAVFRLSPLASPALDARLEARGWRRFDETVVMTGDLADLPWESPRGTAHEVAIAPKADGVWLQNCYRMAAEDAAFLTTLRTMLDGLIPQAGFARIGDGDRLDALALMVVDGDLAGLFEVLTAAEHRRRGLASALLQRLLAWSRERGAVTGWLAVVADNRPALSLYQRLGFREAYRYHYRANA